MLIPGVYFQKESKEEVRIYGYGNGRFLKVWSKRVNNSSKAFGNIRKKGVEFLGDQESVNFNQRIPAQLAVRLPHKGKFENR